MCSPVPGRPRSIVDGLLSTDGPVDFAEAAGDLPLLALADVLGMPVEDRGLLFDWSNRVIGFQDPDYAVSARHAGDTPMAASALRLRPEPGPDGRMPGPRTRAGIPDLYAYAHLLAEHKRRSPGGDVMSVLLSEVDDDGGRVSVEEFENLFRLFAVAGNETLRNGIPGGMVALLAHQDAQRALRADPGLLPAAVEEMLRWWTPVMVFRSTATVPVALSGVDIAAGDKVVVSFAAANRDETVFADPDRVDITCHPNDHLVFGHGPHFCRGQLARAQLTALFGELLRRTRRIEAAGPPVLLRSSFQRGVKAPAGPPAPLKSADGRAPRSGQSGNGQDLVAGRARVRRPGAPRPRLRRRLRPQAGLAARWTSVDTSLTE